MKRWMLSQVILFGITLAACVGAPGDEASIERLLEPASRQEAFLDYLVDSRGDIYTRAELEERNHLISFQKCTKRKLFRNAFFQLVFRDDLSFIRRMSLDPGFSNEGIEPFFKSHPSEILPLDDFEEVFFDSKGKEVKLFANGSVERLISHDLNGDGEVERLTRKTRKPSIFGGEAGFCLQQLLITSISKKPKTLLNVVFNAYPKGEENTNTWGYSVVDRDGDKSYEIEFGPELERGIDPQIVFKWDAKEKKYVGPDGGMGGHFVRIHNEEQEGELERVGLGYEQNPYEAEDNGSAFANGAKSYCPLDVNGVTDQLILAYMGEGRLIDDTNETSLRLPDGLWKMSPTEAALALVDSNRSKSHRAEYKLAVAVGKDESPPAEGSVSVDSHIGCMGVYSWNCDLHFKKERSFLAVAATGSRMRATGSESVHEVRVIPLEYDEARRIGGMMWALTRIRSFPSSSAVRDEGIVFLTSTADGHVELKIEPQGEVGEGVTAEGTCFASSTVCGRWDGPYEPEICANLARQFLMHSLSEYLGARWTSLDPPESYWEDPDSPEGMEILRQQIASVFDEWKEHKDIDADLLAGVVRAAGDSAFTDFLEVLKEIESSIPPVSKAERRFAEAERKGGNRSDWSEAYNAVKREVGYILRDTVKNAIKHLEMIGNGDALAQLASSGLYDSDWALKQLKKISPDRWAETLAAIILRLDKTNERPWEWAAKFELLVESYPDIAQKTAAQMEGKSRVLHLLDTSSAEEILEVVRDEKNGPEVRTRALEVFSSRWPEREEQMVEAALAMIQFPDAAAVLARCESSGQYWESIVAAMNAPDSAFDLVTYLAALGKIAKEEEPFRGKLWQILKPMLRNSRIAVNDVFSLIYDVDLREAAPELKRLATASPDDIGKNMTFYSNKATPIEGRFHLPRQILTAWRTDISPALRAKLLISWRLNLGKRDRLTDELSGVLELLDAKGTGEVLAFVNWAGEASVWSESGKAFLDELSLRLENVRVED